MDSYLAIRYRKLFLLDWKSLFCLCDFFVKGRLGNVALQEPCKGLLLFERIAYYFVFLKSKELHTIVVLVL